VKREIRKFKRIVKEIKGNLINLKIMANGP